MGYKMKNQGKDYASMTSKTMQNIADATDAERAADVEAIKASGESPNKLLMKGLGMLIGANKRRQATQDLADKQVSEGQQKAYSRKFS